MLFGATRRLQCSIRQKIFLQCEERVEQKSKTTRQKKVLSLSPVFMHSTHDIYMAVFPKLCHLKIVLWEEEWWVERKNKKRAEDKSRCRMLSAKFLHGCCLRSVHFNKRQRETLRLNWNCALVKWKFSRMKFAPRQTKRKLIWNLIKSYWKCLPGARHCLHV